MVTQTSTAIQLNEVGFKNSKDESQVTSTIPISLQEYKTCAGMGCSNEGKYSLTVIFINKVGWFCKECRNELVKTGLVTNGEVPK